MSDFDIRNMDSKIEKSLSVLKEDLATVKSRTCKCSPGGQSNRGILRNTNTAESAG